MSHQQWNQGQAGEWAPQQPDGTPEQEGQAQQAGNQEQQAGNQEQQAGNQPRQDWGQQQDWAQQGQTSASEWGQPAPQPSAPQGEWTQSQGGQDWHQAQPQRSAGEWHQAQPQGGQGWNQQQWQGQQGWDQNQQGWDQNQQGWDQNQQWAQQQQQQWGQQNYAQAGSGYSAGSAAQWQQQAPKKPSPFDFSFRRAALPEAAGTIFVVGAIGLGVWWLFRMISALTYLIEYPLDFFVSFLGDAGLALFGIMLLRALLEVGVGVTSRRSDVAEPRIDDSGREDTGTHTI